MRIIKQYVDNGIMQKEEEITNKVAKKLLRQVNLEWVQLRGATRNKPLIFQWGLEIHLFVEK